MKKFLMFVVIAAVFSLTLAACSKDKISTSQQQYDNSSLNVSDRSGDAFYLDGNVISSTSFDAANSNYYHHFVLNIIDDTHQRTDAYLFSTRQMYETWGDARGYKTSKMNQVTDRLAFVADSAGIIPKEETVDYTPPSWFTDYEEKLMSEVTESPDFLCFLSSRLSKQMCNPDVPPGGPSGCSGGTNTTWNYLAPSIQFALTVMNNSASAWLPRKAVLCNGSSYAHFTGYNKWGLHDLIGTITVNLNFPGSGSVIYVPFNGIYARFDNVVSSFKQWGSTNP